MTIIPFFRPFLLDIRCAGRVGEKQIRVAFLPDHTQLFLVSPHLYGFRCFFQVVVTKRVRFYGPAIVLARRLDGCCVELPCTT